MKFAVAEVEMCVDGDGRDNGAAAKNFQVLMSAGINAHRAQIDAKLRSLAAVERFRPNECVRGYLTFKVRTGPEVPVAVQLLFGSSGAISWSLPGGPSAQDPVINDDTPMVIVAAGVVVRLAGDASGLTGATRMNVHSYKGPVPHPGSDPLPAGEEVGAADADTAAVARRRRSSCGATPWCWPRVPRCRLTSVSARASSRPWTSPAMRAPPRVSAAGSPSTSQRVPSPWRSCSTSPPRSASLDAAGHALTSAAPPGSLKAPPLCAHGDDPGRQSRRLELPSAK